MKRPIVAALAAVAVLALTGTAGAEEALKKLQDFKTTGASLRIQQVEQGGARAEALAAITNRIKLPPGFKIELYAIVPDARHMAVGTNVGVVFVGTRKADVWAVTDRDKDRVGDEVKRFAPSIDFKVPNGPCFSKDGFLYIAEHNRLMQAAKREDS